MDLAKTQNVGTKNGCDFLLTKVGNTKDALTLGQSQPTIEITEKNEEKNLFLKDVHLFLNNIFTKHQIVIKKHQIVIKKHQMAKKRYISTKRDYSLFEYLT